ncbi:activating signal cointegrator 1 complex subunit 3-like [Neolamprologus brichardi]|uniref:activating signal cointegrator 1 complex subunit 3-like n=1 Tax=Neolamprologus brichardi TaxID=32507 RepID=UPI001643A34F|nr:activating signal cointegrator 1 complex subunit 3-like [Neolamprologus brichardi]
MSPPRLTGALRSFSSVSKKEDLSEQLYDLKAKRLKRQELFARDGLTWQKIVHFCTEHQDKSQQQAASQELKSLLLAAKQMGKELHLSCLFELLGPEGLDMISTLLQRRAAIVDSLLRIQPDRTVYPSACDWSDMRLVRCAIGPTCIWSDMDLVRHATGPTWIWSDMRLVRHASGPTCDWSDMHLMLLPEGIRRDNCKMYEEVEIPPNEPMPVGFEEKPVYISDIDEIGQLVFKGMKRLNRIQSIVFETAYNTNENLLICAPTGAGKTNIAMLTVLHEIRQHLQPGGVIKKDEFKIVYVAPMKALAAEMTNYFGKRLEPLGITVKELTGDMQLSKGEILRTQMLVTTPEKWDVVTRKSVGDVALSQIVRLLILDEVHLLHEDRGPVLESLVARTIRQEEQSGEDVRAEKAAAALKHSGSDELLC